MTPETDLLAGIEGATPAPAATRRRGRRRRQPQDSRNYDELIDLHTAGTSVDPDLVRAVMGQESEYEPGAVSPKGARGLMQLMPGTARRYGVKNIHDPSENIRGGVQYLDFLHNEFGGDTDLMLAGYNAGEGAVKKHGNRIPPYRETRDYVANVKGRYEKLRNSHTAKPELDLAAGITPPTVNARMQDIEPETDLAAGMVPPGGSNALPPAQVASSVVATQRKAQTPGAATERPAPPAPKISLPDVDSLPVVKQAMAADPVESLSKFDTPLSAAEEAAFRLWKDQHAANDSGEDYDLRGAFKAGLMPDAKTGHWPDRFKKPNHPTFSRESQYATGEELKHAGRWDGDTFVPAGGVSPATDQELHGEIGPLPEGYREAQQKYSQIDTVANAAVAQLQQRNKQDAAIKQAQARRQKIIDNARAEWVKDAEEVAKNAEPDLAKKIVDQARNSSTADVVKYARSRAHQRQQALATETLARDPFQAETRGDFSFEPQSGVPRPNIHEVPIAALQGQLDADRQQKETESVERSIDRAPYMVRIIGQQWPRIVGEAQRQLANIVQYPESFSPGIAITKRAISAMGMQPTPEIATQIGHYLRQQGDINTKLGNYKPESETGIPKAIGRALVSQGYDIGILIAKTRLTGLPFPVVMAGDAAMTYADAGPYEQAKQVAIHYAIGRALETLPGLAQKLLAKAPVVGEAIAAHPEATARTIGAAGFGGLSGGSAYLEGGTREQVAGATAAGALMGGVLAGEGLRPAAKAIAEPLVRNPNLPEWARAKLVKYTDVQSAVFYTDDKAMSYYAGDPAKDELGFTDIPRANAEKAAGSRPLVRVTDEEFQQLQDRATVKQPTSAPQQAKLTGEKGVADVKKQSTGPVTPESQPTSSTGEAGVAPIKPSTPARPGPKPAVTEEAATKLPTAKEIWDARKPVKMAGVDANLSTWQVHDGVSYELYRVGDDKGLIRVFDEDSRNVVSMTKYPSLEKASAAFRTATDDARQTTGGQISSAGGETDARTGTIQPAGRQADRSDQEQRDVAGQVGEGSGAPGVRPRAEPKETQVRQTEGEPPAPVRGGEPEVDDEAISEQQRYVEQEVRAGRGDQLKNQRKMREKYPDVFTEVDMIQEKNRRDTALMQNRAVYRSATEMLNTGKWANGKRLTDDERKAKTQEAQKLHDWLLENDPVFKSPKPEPKASDDLSDVFDKHLATRKQAAEERKTQSTIATVEERDERVLRKQLQAVDKELKHLRGDGMDFAVDVGMNDKTSIPRHEAKIREAETQRQQIVDALKAKTAKAPAKQERKAQPEPTGPDVERQKYRQQKAALTRALAIADPTARKTAVIAAATKAVQEWKQFRAWPDDWHRWQRAVDDVHKWNEPRPTLEELEEKQAAEKTETATKRPEEMPDVALMREMHGSNRERIMRGEGGEGLPETVSGSPDPYAAEYNRRRLRGGKQKTPDATDRKGIAKGLADLYGPAALRMPKGWGKAETSIPYEGPAQFEIKDGNRIELQNLGAIQLLGKAYGANHAGVFEAQPARIIAGLNGYRSGLPLHGSKQLRADIDRLIAAVSKASSKTGTVRIYRPENIRHEGLHEARYEASGRKTPRASYTQEALDRVTSSPMWPKLEKFLESRNYPVWALKQGAYRSDVQAALMEEAAAFIAQNYTEITGDLEHDPLTAKEAIDYMDLFFTAFAETNGRVSLEKFTELINEAEQARQQVYNRIASEGVVQSQPAEALSGVAAERKGGSAQIHGPPAERIFPRYKPSPEQPVIKGSSLSRRGVRRFMKNAGIVWPEGVDNAVFRKERVGLFDFYYADDVPLVLGYNPRDPFYKKAPNGRYWTIPSLLDKSKTKGPIILDWDGRILDGHHRVVDAAWRGDEDIDAYIRIRPDQLEDHNAELDTMAERVGDDSRYQQAKGLFEAGLAPYRDQGLTPQQSVAKLIDELLDTHNLTPEIVGRMKPDILRFMAESVPAHIDDLVHEAATSPRNDLPEPTQGQKEAGNYAKGHVKVAGMDFSIENPEGSTRSGVDPNGKKWEIKLKSHYGYIKRTEGADGEQIDAYLRPGANWDINGPIFVVNQTKGNGHFDEHKVMLGWATEAEARSAYLANYEKGWDRFSSIAHFENPEAFKNWLKDEDNTVPAETPDDAEAMREAFGSVDAPNVPALGRAFAGEFANGRTFKTIIEARQFAADLLGDRVEPGTQAAKKVDEAVELGVVMHARNVVAQVKRNGVEHGVMVEPETYYALRELYGQQPSLNVKTSTSVVNQAYSTPVPLAYLASRLAGITPDLQSVYEPTAGNGALLIEADPRSIIANERDADRAANLEASLPDANVSRHDASIFRPNAKAVDVVIANPPFGPVKEDGQTKRFQINDRYTTSEIDHAIALKALEAMKDDGSAVLIVGGITATDEKQRSDGYATKAKLEFYVTLYGEYNVVDHFTVNGDLYKKQGAGWPVDVIVIHGRGPSKRTLPAADVPRIYDSWDELQGVLDEPYRKSLDARRQLSSRSGEGKVSSGPGPRDVSRTARGETERTPAAGAEPRGSSAPANNRPGGPAAGLSGTGLAGEPVAGRQPVSGVQADNERAGLVSPENGITGRPAGATATERAGGTEGVRAERPGELANQPDESTRQRRPVEKADVTQMQGPYRPSSKLPGLNTKVPLNMKAAIEAALDNLVARVGDLDDYVAKELGYTPEELEMYFSAEQADATAMAIDSIKSGAGFIIGDQGGIGKGRVVAAMIRWALRHDKIPIFVTEKPNLYKDIVRDLTDIGEGVIPDWIERAIMTNMNETVPLDDEDVTLVLKSSQDSHKGKLQQMINEGSIKPHDVIFTTYNGMQTISGGKRTIRQDFLQEFARDAVLLFDESHNAGGAEKKDNKNKNAGPPLDRALFARQIIELAYGVFYSSATYAKRPQTMDLYSKTDMRKAFASLADMVTAVEKGGVPMQQAMAAMLAERGQYIRRERDFEGMTYDTKELEVDKPQAEQTSAVLRSIFDFDRARLAAIAEMDKAAKAAAKKIVGSDGATGKAGVEGSNFTSLMHNLVNQMLLMLKTESAVDEALAVLKADEKPVITLSNTMGSFIENYAKDNGLTPGDAVGLTFGDMLKRYLERSRDVRIGKAFGPTIKHHLSDEELGPEGLAAYDKTLKMIMDTDWSGMPVSPIDYMKHRLAEHGYKAGEITGRQHILDYKTRKATAQELVSSRDRGKAAQMFFDTIYRTRSKTESGIQGRSKTLTAFNKGELDALIINQAGSTGLSIHASSKFRDQRRRVMLILQPELNIDTHMQMLYRVDRTGQVVKPRYLQLGADVPAEKRPMAILSKKMASLNANTTAAKGSAYEGKDVPDFMNEYGDEVVASLMEDDPDLHKLIGKPLKDAQGHSGLSRKDAIRKVTGRIPLLPIEQQQHLYDLIESEYKDLIARLDAMGENSLEAKSLDLDAKLLKKTEIFKGKGDSPFERGAWAEESDVKRIGKPYKTEQVVTLLQEATGSDSTDFRTLQRKGEELANARDTEAYGRFEDFRNDIVNDIKDPARATAQRVKLMGNWTEWNQRNRELAVGATIKMGTPLGELYGIVTKIEQKGNPKNPIALGSWRATIAIADAVRSVTIPFSKLDPVASVKGNLLSSHYAYAVEPYARIMDREKHERVTVPVLEAFDRKQTEAREHRVILTGNIPAAFGRFKKGRIMNFTDDEGQLRHGVMMPADFNLEKAMNAEPVQFTFADDIIKFLSGGSRLITTPDNTLRLNWTHGSLQLSTSATKAAGGQYFLNDKILDAAGDEFVKSGNNMKMLVDGARAEAVINAILKSGFTLETSSYKEEAERIVKANPRRGQSGSWNPAGLHAPTGYETPNPSQLSGLWQRLRAARGALRGPSAPKKKYSTVGSLRDIWVGNLSQLEQANMPTFEAALRAAGAKSTARILMRRAANQIQRLMRTKNGWDLFRAVMTQARLYGVRDRWMELSYLATHNDDEELQEFYAGGGEDDQPGIRHLVAMLEGMPWGKEFKQNEGLDASDSLTGIVDSLLASDDLDAARSTLSNIFTRAAESVAEVMDEDTFNDISASRAFREALPVYKDLLERPMNEAHSLNEGIFSDALGPLDTYYPLSALDEAGNALHRVGMKVYRGTEYRPPENPRNKMATGLSPLYDTSPEALGHAISQAERRNSVANLLRVAEREGLIQTLKRKEQAPKFALINGEETVVKVIQKGKDRTLFIDGKTVHVPAPRIVVPEWLYKELQPILEEGDFSQGRFAAFVSRLNLFGMAGPIDAAAHIANIIGALVVGTPYVGTSILSKTIGNTPVTKLMNTLLTLALTDPWTDDAVKDIEAMSKLGVIPSRYATVVTGWMHRGRQFAGQTGAQKKFLSLAPLLYGPGGLDIRARLVMYRTARHFAPDATPAELKRFIDQMGNYTFELHGAVEAFLKKWGIAPFYTAGSTMWRTGIKSTFGATPLPTSTMGRGKRSVLRARMLLSGGIIGVVGLWLLMYKAYTGKWPWEDERSRLLQIPLNDKDRHHWLADKVYGSSDDTAYVGMGILSPLVERGLRATGATAAYNAKMVGATKGQAFEEAMREVANSAAHPFVSGPVTNAGIVAATSVLGGAKHPYISGTRDLTGKPSIQFLPAMKTKEPGASTIKAGAIESIAALNSFYSNVARNIGFVQEGLDLDTAHNTRNAATQPNPWLRMIIDLAAPRLIKGTANVGKQKKKFQRLEKATESSIRREEGLPKKKPERERSHGPKGPSGPRGPESNAP